LGQWRNPSSETVCAWPHFVLAPPLDDRNPQRWRWAGRKDSHTRPRDHPGIARRALEGQRLQTLKLGERNDTCGKAHH
jgi:hypothetical protein